MARVGGYRECTSGVERDGDGSDVAEFRDCVANGCGRPVASNLNFTPGETIPNLVIVQVGAGGKISLYNREGSTDVIADVVGYYR